MKFDIEGHLPHDSEVHYHMMIKINEQTTMKSLMYWRVKND